jgi:hypothetical protein
MKIRTQLPFTPLTSVPPPKPPPEGWAAELAEQEELGEVTRPRQLQQRGRPSTLRGRQPSDEEEREVAPRSSGKTLDFLA